MTTIVDVLKRAARQCSVDEPSLWLTATDEDHVALRDDFLVETCEEVLDRIDLPIPVSFSVAITSATSKLHSAFHYRIAADCRRLQRDPLAVYETTSTRRACLPITDDGMWTHIQQIGSHGSHRYYRFAGYDGLYAIEFYPELATGDSITVHYITDNWMSTSGGTEGSAFTAVDDVLVLPRRLVEWGIIWRFRLRNGLPYEDALARFEAELNRVSNDMRGRRRIDFSDASTIVAPWDVPIPDFLPEA